MLMARPAAACDLALALAVDVSGSVDSREFGIQMDGLASALRDPVISEALVRAQAQVLLVQWTGATRQRLTLPWTQIDSFEAADRFAAAVENDKRIWRNYSTAIGDALAFTMAQFDGVECTRRIIDVSGDGSSNEGRPPDSLHPELKERRITVKTIAIEESEDDLTAYFYENVIVGEGAFVETARKFEDYPDGIRRKLLREVAMQSAGTAAPPMPPVIPAGTAETLP